MAEIRVEPKERRVRPWVLLGLVLLALIAWWLVSQQRRGETVVTETRSGAVGDTVAATAVGTAEGTPGPVNDFLRYLDENREQFGTRLAHRYTSEAIRRLAAGLGGITERDTVGGSALRPQLDAMRERADALQRNEESTNHARYARDAFERAASIMDDLRRRQYPNVAQQVREVREAVEAVQPGRLLLDQADEVRRFFDRAGTALRDMANTEDSPGVDG